MNEQLDPEIILGMNLYVKNTNSTVQIMSFDYTKERCLVKVAFLYGNKPCKTCYQMCEQMKVSKIKEYTDGAMGGFMYYNNQDLEYIGVYDIKNLCSVPFGGPAAQLIYGDQT